MGERRIAVQFRDPTEEAAIAEIDNPFSKEWSTIAAPKSLVRPPEILVEPINGVKMGHQTGIKTVGSIELGFIELKQLRRQGLISWGALRVARRRLNREIAKLRMG